MDLIKHIRIGNGKVYVNEELFYENEVVDFRSFGRSLYKYLGISYAKFYKMSALSKLGFLASEILLIDENLSQQDPGKVSLILANASSSLHTDVSYQETIASKPSPAIFVYTLPNIVIGEICIRNGFMGEGLFFIQESFDKDFIFDYAENLLISGRSERCIAGWIEVDMEGEYHADLSLLC